MAIPTVSLKMGVAFWVFKEIFRAQAGKRLVGSWAVSGGPIRPLGKLGLPRFPHRSRLDRMRKSSGFLLGALVIAVSAVPAGPGKRPDCEQLRKEAAEAAGRRDQRIAQLNARLRHAKGQGKVDVLTLLVAELLAERREMRSLLACPVSSAKGTKHSKHAKHMKCENPDCPMHGKGMGKKGHGGPGKKGEKGTPTDEPPPSTESGKTTPDPATDPHAGH